MFAGGGEPNTYVQLGKFPKRVYSCATFISFLLSLLSAHILIIVFKSNIPCRPLAMIRPKRIIESSVGLAAAANFKQLAKRIVCVGRNYPDPVVDAKVPRPTQPILFMKSTSAFIDETQLIRKPIGCNKLLTEVELGGKLITYFRDILFLIGLVVFGKTTSNVSRHDAMNYVAGYTIALDMTAGDVLVCPNKYHFLKSTP